jgi:acetyl esterase/lipase
MDNRLLPTGFFGLTFIVFAMPLRAETTQEDFGPDVTAAIYKHASGDDLWIYRFDPAGHNPKTDRCPAVVFFFGGGWNGGTVKQFQQQARYLAGRGMVVFLADYRVRPLFPAISPAHNISADDPPTIVFLGTKDSLIPVETAERFDAALKDAGIRSELRLYPNQPHGFFNESKSPEAFLDTVKQLDAFLVSLGWLTGPADEDLLQSLRSTRK